MKPIDDGDERQIYVEERKERLFQESNAQLDKELNTKTRKSPVKTMTRNCKNGLKEGITRKRTPESMATDSHYGDELNQGNHGLRLSMINPHAFGHYRRLTAGQEHWSVGHYCSGKSNGPSKNAGLVVQA